MATHKKEEVIQPRYDHLTVYLPNTNEGEANAFFHIYHEVGKNKVKAIDLLSARMIMVEMEDGEQLHYCGMAFTYRKYPQSKPKTQPRL